MSSRVFRSRDQFCRVVIAGVAVSLVAGLSTAGGDAPDLRLLAHDTSRLGMNGDCDFSFVSGNVHTGPRNSILSPGAFGPGGVVERTVVLAETNTITGALLEHTDVVVITTLPSTGLTCHEQEVIRAFIEQGGGVIAFANSVSTSLAPVLECGEAEMCGSGTFSFEPGASGHPVLAGPFGQLSGPFGATFQCRFASLGPHGTSVIASDAPVGAVFELGSGRAFVINEEEWAMSEGGCPSAPFYNPTGERLIRNALAWVAPPAGFAFDATGFGPCPADLDTNCLLDLADVTTFAAAFLAMDPIADLNPDGLFDLSDVNLFVTSFLAGCG